MSVIWLIVLLLLRIAMYNICLFERQFVRTNDLQLTRFYEINAVMLLHWQQNIRFQYPVPFNISAGSEAGTG